MPQDGIQLESATHAFKFEAPDGKQRKAAVLNSDGVILLAKHYPSNRAVKFPDWFTYSDNTIAGQTRKKAYTLFESGLLNSLEPGSMKFRVYSGTRKTTRELIPRLVAIDRLTDFLMKYRLHVLIFLFQ